LTGGRQKPLIERDVSKSLRFETARSGSFDLRLKLDLKRARTKKKRPIKKRISFRLKTKSENKKKLLLAKQKSSVYKS